LGTGASGSSRSAVAIELAALAPQARRGVPRLHVSEGYRHTHATLAADIQQERVMGWLRPARDGIDDQPGWWLRDTAEAPQVRI
jgi:hypothetical protein